MQTLGDPDQGIGDVPKEINLELDLAWRLGPGDTKPVPSNLFALLQGVSDHGSLSAAAKQNGISYRGAWNLIHEWSDFLGTPLIAATRGQGAHLTPLGQKLVWGNEYARSSLREAGSSALADVQDAIDRVLMTDEYDSLTIHASHCLSHETLRELYFDQTGTKLDLKHSGSGTSLEHLKAGDCHVAGFHLVDGDLREKFRSRYLQIVDPEGIKLITALKRRQGLIVPRGNPLCILRIEDLVVKKARIVNRQLNSGTRLLLDELVYSSNIDPADIIGYENEEFTHTAVGALVAENSADAALGTEAAALKFNLDFIPLVTETYYYAIPDKRWNQREVKALRDLLGGRRWKECIEQIDGYDVSLSGRVDEGVSVLGTGSPTRP